LQIYTCTENDLQVKNEIILKALAEHDDLGALRQEKRALAEGELNLVVGSGKLLTILATETKRLRAMRDLEKVGKHSIDASKIQKQMHDDRIRAQVEKRELRRQRLQMQAVEDEQQRRTVMKDRRPAGYT